MPVRPPLPPKRAGCRWRIEMLDPTRPKRVHQRIHHCRKRTRAPGLATPLSAEYVRPRWYRVAEDGERGRVPRTGEGGIHERPGRKLARLVVGDTGVQVTGGALFHRSGVWTQLSQPRLGLGATDGDRAPRLQHSVQGMNGNIQFECMMLYHARARSVTNHPLEPSDGSLGPAQIVLKSVTNSLRPAARSGLRPPPP